MCHIAKQQFADLAHLLLETAQNKEAQSKTIMTPSAVAASIQLEKAQLLSIRNLSVLCNYIVTNLQTRVRDIDFDKIRKRKLELRNEVIDMYLR